MSEIYCGVDACPILLNSSCVFYQGQNLLYIGVNTNDNIQIVIEKINQAFQNTGIGYGFTNGVIQPTPSDPVQLGGALIQDTTIDGNYTLTFTGNLKAAKHITTGGNSSQFVKGDGTLDSTSYQTVGNYLTGLSGDGTASGPGVGAFTLATVNYSSGVFGNGSTIPIITVNPKGLVTNITPTPIVVPPQPISFIGDVVGSGVTDSSVTLLLQNINSNVYPTLTPLKFSVSSKGLITSASPLTSSDIISILGPLTGTGTVTSVATSGPLTGGPITTTGTIGITQSTTSTDGYLSSVDWNTFNSKENPIVAGTTLQYYRGDKTFQTINTSVVPELTNLYYTDLRARASISETITGLDYNSTTGVFILTAGYVIPTTSSAANWDLAYNDKINSAEVTGTTTKTLTLTQQDGGTITASWTDINSGGVTSVFGRTGIVSALETDYQSFYPRLSETYDNPTWINSLAWLKITGTPTTLSGYGITDAIINSGLSTDNAIVRFDGTTGKIIQNSVVTLDDLGNESGILSQQFADGSGVALAEGKMWYDATLGNWNLGMGGGNITQQIGEELFLYGKASTAINDSTLQLVYKTGVVGASGVITFAPTIAGLDDDDKIIGIATEAIPLNGFGRVTEFGLVRGINTTGTAYGETWVDDDDLFYNPVTGGLTKVRPLAPNMKLFVGTVINAGSGGSGSFNVKIGVSKKLTDLDNLEVITPLDKDLLVYNSATTVWENKSLAQAGIVPLTRTITINGLAQDLSIDRSWSVGTIISISTTGPITGGLITNSGTIGINQATTSSDGYLSSVDWNTFNNKADSGANTDITSITLTSGTVNNSPLSSNDLVNKLYVDTLAASGIHYHEAVLVESPDSTGNLNASYNQPGGSGDGVGATLTNSGTQEALTIDGILMTLGNRVLVYNQTNIVENGVYVVTVVGDVSTNWVLTRSSDTDTYDPLSPDALGQGDAFYVKSGNTGIGEIYLCNTVGEIIFGTTGITFIQISSPQVYSAGAGLNLTDLIFSISDIGTAGTYGSSTLIPVITTNAKGQVTSVTTAANPQGTVTSVNGTGTVSGLTLSGTVTSSGSLTLGGTLSLTSTNVTDALGYTPYNSTNPNNYITLSSLSSTATGLSYNNTTGEFTLTFGYSIPTDVNQSNWDVAYNDKINSAEVTGTTTKTLTLTQEDGGIITASWTDINSDRNIDGGASATVYLISQNINGGNA